MAEKAHLEYKIMNKSQPAKNLWFFKHATEVVSATSNKGHSSELSHFKHNLYCRCIISASKEVKSYVKIYKNYVTIT